MDRVKNMAAGITEGPVSPEVTISTRPSQGEFSPRIRASAFKSGCFSNVEHSEGFIDEMHCSSKSIVHKQGQEHIAFEKSSLRQAQDVNGSMITLNDRLPIMSIYPECQHADSGRTKRFQTLMKVCNKFKSKSKCMGITEDPLTQVLWNAINSLNAHHRTEFICIVDDKHSVKWKAYFIIDGALCATHVSHSKKEAKNGVVMAAADLWNSHNAILLQKGCYAEDAELGLNHMLVYTSDYVNSTSNVPDVCDIDEDNDTEILCEGYSVISAQSILESLPRQIAFHKFNQVISPAPKFPNFVLFESPEEARKYGYENPVGKLVNSASKCKIPIEFVMDTMNFPSANAGIVCTVFMNRLEVGRGLACSYRAAKHLAAHNAIQALKMTNITLRKSLPTERNAVSRSELMNGTAQNNVISDSNIGHKLLKMMGWKGEGGLGKEGKGIEAPVNAVGTSSRSKEGLGFDLYQLKDPSTKTLDDRKVWQFLQDYARSDRNDELVFTSELNSNERKKLHSMSLKLGLKSKSKGKGDIRYLTIRRKFNVSQLVQAVAEKGGNLGNYEIIGPSL